MHLGKALAQIQHKAHQNAPILLTAGGVSGVVVTAYLTGRASYAAGYDNAINEDMMFEATDGRTTRAKKSIARHWRSYVPATLAGATAITCVIGAHRAHSRRTVSERAYSEYRDKIVEVLGEKKEQAVRDEIAQDRVSRNPPTTQELVLAGPGNVLCCEAFTGRYFHSDMETLRKAENELNAKILRNMYAYLDDWYHMLGLPYTQQSGELGWDSDKLMELRWSSTLIEGKPCLVFEYNYVKAI
jgi:Family of unknown function (DUF6353)